MAEIKQNNKTTNTDYLFKDYPYNPIITPGQNIEQLANYFPNQLRCGYYKDFDHETNLQILQMNVWAKQAYYEKNGEEGYISIMMGGIENLDDVDSFQKIIDHCPLLARINFWQRKGLLLYSANCYITEEVKDPAGSGRVYRFPKINPDDYPYILESPKDMNAYDLNTIIQLEKWKEIDFDFPTKTSKTWLLHIDIRIFNWKGNFWDKFIRDPRYSGEIISIWWLMNSKLSKQKWIDSWDYFLKTQKYNCPLEKVLYDYKAAEYNKVTLHYPKTKEWRDEIYAKEIEDDKNGVPRPVIRFMTQEEKDEKEAKLSEEYDNYEFYKQIGEIEMGQRKKLDGKAKEFADKSIKICREARERRKNPNYDRTSITIETSDPVEIGKQIGALIEAGKNEKEREEESDKPKTKAEIAVKQIALHNQKINNANVTEIVGKMQEASRLAERMHPEHVMSRTEYANELIENGLHICDIVLGLELPSNVNVKDVDPPMLNIPDDIADDNWSRDLSKSSEMQDAMKYIDKPFNSAKYIRAHGNQCCNENDVIKEQEKINSKIEQRKQRYTDYINNRLDENSMSDLEFCPWSVYHITQEQLDNYNKECERQSELHKGIEMPIEMRYNYNWDEMYHTVVNTTNEFIIGNDLSNNCYIYIKTELFYPGYSPVINNLVLNDTNTNTITINYNNINAYYDSINNTVYLKVPNNIAIKYLKPQPYYNTIQITKQQYYRTVAKSISDKYIYKVNISDNDSIFVYTPRTDSRLVELHGGSDSDEYG